MATVEERSSRASNRGPHGSSFLGDLAWAFDVFGIIHDECQVDTSPESSIAALGSDWKIVGQGLGQAMLDYERDNDLDILSKLEDETNVARYSGTT